MTTNTMHTVSELIQDRWESEEPDRVIQALTPLNGKPCTKRILDKLPGGSERWRLRREYGMTHLVTLDYLRSGGNTGISLLLAHTEAADFPIDTRDIEQRNPAYFDARRKRNHARMEARNTRETLQGVADAMNRVQRAKAELLAAIEQLETWTDYGQPAEQDKYEIQRACGLRDAKGHLFISPDFTEGA
jgi:hypothetical protein